ncbi:MAG: methyltransferase domain-containing protein [Solirubrobacteraceae bacterium]
MEGASQVGTEGSRQVGDRYARRRLARTFSSARWDEYRRLLAHALACGYSVVPLEDWLRRPDDDATAPTLILRHDVDQHPRSVIPMLAAERDLGIVSTWYFRWRTADARVITAVRRAGGGVGLHYETLTRRLLRAGPAERPEEETSAGREELRAEIAAFKQLFGPIRSICPHGDSRVPGVNNRVLVRDRDLHALGVELDGNESLRGHRLAAWLTDRSAPDGGWSEGRDPFAMLSEGRTPILCLTHPNNFASGASLWRDRLLAAALPDPRPGRRRLLSRTGTDEPATPDALAPVPEDSAFAPVAATLERAVRTYYADRGEALTRRSGLNTLLTNSQFAERRTETLLEVLFRGSELNSVDGARVLDVGCGFGAMAVVLAWRGAAVTAIDPNVERFAVGQQVAERHGLSIDFRRARMEAISLGGAQFDLAVLNNSFCYLREPWERQAALRAIAGALRPGGWLIMRNPNRLFPVDQFTGLPLIGMLAPGPATAAARRFGRERSTVRLASAWGVRRELRSAGFVDIGLASPRRGAVHRQLAHVARYQHVLARTVTHG